MPRPPAVCNDTYVDADACARAESIIERRFAAQDLPRLRETGVGEQSVLEARLKFSLFDGLPVVRGKLHGTLWMTCQRCMRPAAAPIAEDFDVIIVAAERADEPGGYEPFEADASHLDVGWLVEEQALLALPLVPMHESEECNAVAAAPSETDEAVRQQPFQNLRDLLRKR